MHRAIKPNDRTGNTFSPTSASPEDVVAALLYLYSKQTADEAAQQSTSHQNGEGFSAFDASILSQISEKILSTNTITERQLSLTRAKLNKYRKQLQNIPLQDYYIKDLRISDFVVKTAAKPIDVMSCEMLEKDIVRLRFPYDEQLLIKIKTLSNRRYISKPNDRYWTAPATPANLRMIMNMGFTLPQECLDILTPIKVDFNFDGLKKQLRPYQIQGATRLAGELNLNGLLADEMGLGKTAQALAAVFARPKDAFPALVVCNSTLKWNWAREGNLWLPKVTVRVLEGYSQRRSYKHKENELTIVNYDILADQTEKIRDATTGKMVKGKVKRRGWASILKGANFKTIIFDECQKIKNQKSQRTIAALSLANKIPNIIALSGTPIENRPIEFWPILSLLAPNLFPNFWTFAHRYCDAQSDGFGWSFKGSSNAKELHDILVNSIMIRRLKKDVAKELPAKVRSVIPIEINMTKYRQAEKALVSYIGAQKGLTLEEQAKKAASTTQKGAEGLAAIERCKQAAILGKMPAVLDWINDYLESDRKLVVFATHTFVLDMLEKEFKGICVRVDGSTSNERRMQHVDTFQGDDKIRLFIGNIRAAGVGITLTAASDTLTLELGWTPGEHDQAEDRVHRIGQEADSVTAYYLVAKGTVEEDIAALLDAKRDVLSQILDGKPAKDFDMITKLMQKVIDRNS